MPSLFSDILYFRHIDCLNTSAFWHKLAGIPEKVYQDIRAILKYPHIYKLVKPVDGLISFNVGITLYEAVLNSEHASNNVIEVGAYKGLSTVYLSMAARKTGRRVKSFESFAGLPLADSVLDSGFKKNEFCSCIEEYRSNITACGCSEAIDLVVGDAREKLLPAIGEDGFAVAFLDVDVYEVTRDMLVQLWSIARGGEVIIIHDAYSLGIRKAIDEFHKLTNNIGKESFPEIDTIKLSIPQNLINIR